MPRYLSRQWLSEAGEAANADPARTTLAGLTLSLRQVVTGGPEGDVSYVLRIDDGHLAVTPDGHDSDATFIQDYPTAAALFRGDLSAQDAFASGRIKVSGNMGKLMANQPALAEIGTVFDRLRHSTTY